MPDISRKKRMQWFNNARFGMFIHWGLYSILGRGEAVRSVERIPEKEYADLAARFNPRRFNIDAWLDLAEKAGAKYTVLTARHHDGFCLFDSKVSDFTTAKTKARRDFIKEYVNSCRRKNIKVGLYYSLLDWRFPGYFNMKKYPESFKAMVAQAHNQVRELMTHYGRIDYMFFDGEWLPGVPLRRGNSPMIAESWRSKELVAMMKKLQPHIVINDRTGLKADVDSPEDYIAASEPGRAWETCMTIGDSRGWGYIENNPNLKTTTQLIQNLVITAGGGGNLLLNVGPKADGTVQTEFVDRLLEIGKWLKVNGESIYGSERVPDAFGYGGGMVGAMTVKDQSAFLHVFRWPAGGAVTIVGIKNRILDARLLMNNKRLGVEQNSDGKVILTGLPQDAPDKRDTVIKLKLTGKPETYSYKGKPLA